MKEHMLFRVLRMTNNIADKVELRRFKVDNGTYVPAVVAETEKAAKAAFMKAYRYITDDTRKRAVPFHTMWLDGRLYLGVAVPNDAEAFSSSTADVRKFQLTAGASPSFDLNLQKVYGSAF